MQSSTPGYPLWSSSIVAWLVGLRRSLVRHRRRRGRGVTHRNCRRPTPSGNSANTGIQLNHCLELTDMLTIDCVDRDEIIANRESGKIGAFLSAMVAQGRMTEFERQIVDQEAHEVYRHAGYLDQNGRLISTGG